MNANKPCNQCWWFKSGGKFPDECTIPEGINLIDQGIVFVTPEISMEKSCKGRYWSNKVQCIRSAIYYAERKKQAVIAIYPDSISGIVFCYGDDVIEELDHPIEAAMELALLAYQYAVARNENKINVLLYETQSKYCLDWKKYMTKKEIAFNSVKGLCAPLPIDKKSNWIRKNSHYAKKLFKVEI